MLSDSFENQTDIGPAVSQIRPCNKILVVERLFVAATNLLATASLIEGTWPVASSNDQSTYHCRGLTVQVAEGATADTNDETRLKQLPDMSFH